MVLLEFQFLEGDSYFLLSLFLFLLFCWFAD